MVGGKGWEENVGSECRVDRGQRAEGRGQRVRGTESTRIVDTNLMNSPAQKICL